MSDTATQERRSALDDFAARTVTAPGEYALAPVSQQMPSQRPQQALEAYRAPDRDERRVLQRIALLASAAGEDFFYRFPVKDKGRTSWIEDISINGTDAVAMLYGNCVVDCPIVADHGNVILYQARFVDLETGFTLLRPFQQSKSASRLGGSDNERRGDIAFQIGVSKAQRNVVRHALRTYCDYAFEEAKRSLVSKIGSDIERWRGDTIAAVTRLVPLPRVEAVIGRPASAWLAPDIARVRAMGRAIVDGMATAAESFPPLAGEDDSALNKFASSGPMEPPPNGPEARGVDTTASTGVKHEAPAPVEPDERQMTGEPTKAATRRLYQMCLEKVLGAATDQKVDVDDRLANLDGPVRDAWEAQTTLDHNFVQTALALAAAVARGERTMQEYRRLMEARVP